MSFKQWSITFTPELYFIIAALQSKMHRLVHECSSIKVKVLPSVEKFKLGRFHKRN